MSGPTIGRCEWCGLVDHDLVAGECPRCRAKVEGHASYDQWRGGLAALAAAGHLPPGTAERVTQRRRPYDPHRVIREAAERRREEERRGCHYA